MRIAAAHLLRLTVLLGAVVLLSAGSAVPATQALARATTERPDDRPGPQVHLVYAVASDGADRQLDTNGTLADSIAVWEQWFVQQTGGRLLRLDTFQGQPDITFLRLPYTAQQIANSNPNELTLFRTAVSNAGLTSSAKLYGVYYDGASSAATCGRGGNLLAIVYLTRNALVNCEADPFRRPGEPAGYREFIMVHELLHGLGFVPACAPHGSGDGHVSDPTDVMYGSTLGPSPQLDVGRDDYFQAPIPGCRDLADSSYLALPAPPGPPTGVTAVAGDAQATVSFTPVGPPVSSYSVTATPGGATATGSSSPITVTALDYGTSYTFVVTALNGTEVGPTSAASNAVTPLGAPTNATAVAGDGHARVSFSQPAVGGGLPIAYYTATASPGGASAHGQSSPIAVAGLENGTSYTFRVTATSGLGTSVASSPSSPVVPEHHQRPPDEAPPAQPRPVVPELVPAPSPRRPPPPTH